MRSCLGVVLAGLATRAEVGVGGLEEAVQVLEEAHAAAAGHTSYRFALEHGKVFAQVERPEASETADGEDAVWRTLVELVS